MSTRRQRGFTLVEVLVGLVLLAAFIGGIYTVVIGSLVARQKIEESASVYQAGPTILDLVEKDLRAAYFRGVKDLKALKAREQSVGGQSVTVLDLVTTTDSKVAIEMNDELMRSDVTEVGYRMKASDTFSGFLELYRREQFFFDDEPLGGGQYYLIYDRIRSLSMRFFEKQDEQGSVTSNVAAEEGLEDWDSEEKKGMPKAVKLTLVLGTPAEEGARPEDLEREYVFERWVLLPYAWDKSPAPEDDEGETDR